MVRKPPLMRPFSYAAPSTLEQAVAVLAESPNTAALAGGTDLIALMKDHVQTPTRLVDVKGIEGLDGVRADGEVLRIGALARIDDLAENGVLKRRLPTVATACRHVGSPQLRSRGTLGGNLCQRPRCWYFRKGYGLLARLDGESMVARGDNRYHAILGNRGAAKFVTPSTVAPLLIALGTEITVVGPAGERRLPLADFYRVPEREGEREHDLAADELVTEVVVPFVPGRRVTSYEVRPGKALDWSLATASVALDVDGGAVRGASVVLGQVAPTPWRARGAEERIVGASLREIDERTIREASEATVAEATPLSMNGYKVQLARVAVERALGKLTGGGA